MITFKSLYFDGKDSRAHEVTVSAGGETLFIRGEGIDKMHEIAKCTVEPALGSTRRTLYTPDGGRIDTLDHKAFQTLERERKGTWGFRFVHLLESRWKTTLVSVGVAVMAVIVISMWGIPGLAEKAAFSLPDGALQAMGKGALASVDRQFLKPSELDPGERERLRSLVERFAAETGAPEPWTLVFRKSPFGPNAFALPGKIVVLTDELVAFVEKDEEILGVAAHELAHLEQRHAVRSLLQGSGVFILVSVLAGDVASITSAAGALPAILLESRYSRGFEQEADLMASRWMIAAGHGVQPMIDFLTRLADSHPGAESPEFLSSHPALEKRIIYLRALAEGG